MPASDIPKTSVNDEELPDSLTKATRIAEQILGEPGTDWIAGAAATIKSVLKLGLDEDAQLVAALLYLSEVEPTARPTLAKALPRGARKLFADISKFSVVERFQQTSEQESLGNSDALRKMLLTMINDPRLVVIYLAWQLQLLRDAKNLSLEEAGARAKVTRNIHAPLANRLGIWQLKWELEDLALRYLQPDDYQRIAKRLAMRRIDRERYIERVTEQLETALEDAGINADVRGRPKHIYSIWKKMQNKQLRFDDLYDLRAFRIVVDNISTCYAALGIVHGLWSPITGQFDDYIARPKPNLYRSLHTAVIGPEGKSIEVQIRTWEMHQSSELGVAAHWRYKEGAQADRAFEERVIWLRKLLESDEPLGTMAADIFSERVYVVSPQGEIIDLPSGATALDFAYDIHSEVGHRCRGAKVNGNIAPLTQRLTNGDQVEILTSQTGTPSRDWLNPDNGYLITAKARNKARQWFKHQDHDQNVDAGRDILDRELDRLGYRTLAWDEVAIGLGKNDVDDLLAALGRGDITPGQLTHWLNEQRAPTSNDELLRVNHRQPPKPTDTGICVQGLGNLMNSLAKCCSPVPGDPISGFITTGRGVSVHRADCANLLRLQTRHPQRVLEVSWGESKHTYPTELSITAYDRSGLLRDITSLLAGEHINVLGVRSVSDHKEHIATISLTVEVTDLTEIGRLLSRIGQVPNVVSAKRLGESS